MKGSAISLKDNLSALRARKTFQRAVNIRSHIIRLFLHIFLIVVAFVFLYPFLYMMITSVKSESDLRNLSVVWIPTQLHWKNYVTAAAYLDIPVHLKNSLMITIFSTIGHILSASFIAYGLARFKFRGRTLMFCIVIFSIIVPPQLVLLPQYMMYSSMGMINTYFPIVLPTFFGYGLRGGLYIFLFRQAYLGMPTEIEDAAQVDGYGYLSIYWRIALPMMRPSIVVSCLVSIVWHWNDYFEPSVYLLQIHRLPLPSMLVTVFNGTRDVMDAILNDKLDMLVTDGVVMAAIVICILPVLLVFTFIQRGFVEGVERSGLVE